MLKSKGVAVEAAPWSALARLDHSSDCRVVIPVKEIPTREYAHREIPTLFDPLASEHRAGMYVVARGCVAVGERLHGTPDGTWVERLVVEPGQFLGETEMLAVSQLATIVGESAVSALFWPTSHAWPTSRNLTGLFAYTAHAWRNLNDDEVVALYLPQRVALEACKDRTLNQHLESESLRKAQDFFEFSRPITLVDVCHRSLALYLNLLRTRRISKGDSLCFPHAGIFAAAMDLTEPELRSTLEWGQNTRSRGLRAKDADPSTSPSRVLPAQFAGPLGRPAHVDTDVVRRNGPRDGEEQWELRVHEMTIRIERVKTHTILLSETRQGSPVNVVRELLRNAITEKNPRRRNRDRHPERSHPGNPAMNFVISIDGPEAVRR